MDHPPNWPHHFGPHAPLVRGGPREPARPPRDWDPRRRCFNEHEDPEEYLENGNDICPACKQPVRMLEYHPPREPAQFPVNRPAHPMLPVNPFQPVNPAPDELAPPWWARRPVCPWVPGPFQQQPPLVPAVPMFMMQQQVAMMGGM